MPTKKSSSSKKASSKKTTVKKSTRKTPAKKSSSKTPVAGEDKLAEDLLKFVDQTAHLLREGIRTGRDSTTKAKSKTVQTKSAFKKDADKTLQTAESSLINLVKETSSALRKGLKGF